MQGRLLTFTNSRGESITFDGSPFSVSEIEGLGDVDADVQMQRAPYQDGANYIDSVLEPRPIAFQVLIRGDNDTDISQKRSQLAALFNPKLGPGTFAYRYGDVERIINAIPEHVPMYPRTFENRGRNHQIAFVDLICPNPYWRSTSITEEPAFEPLFRWPISGTQGFRMGMQRAQRIIHNDGDAPAPLQIDFYGPAQSPIIENLRTGEIIRINRPLAENETFKIDTEESTLFYVDENGNETNVFNWIDTDSTFFKLELGDNEITCHCAISNNQKDFDIRYHKLYVAV